MATKDVPENCVLFGCTSTHVKDLESYSGNLYQCRECHGVFKWESWGEWEVLLPTPCNITTKEQVWVGSQAG